MDLLVSLAYDQTAICVVNEETAKYRWKLRWGQHQPWIANSYLCAVDVWPDLPRLEASSQAGCNLCTFLRKLIKDRNVTVDLPKSGSDEVGIWVDFRYLPLDDETESHEKLRNFLERANVFVTGRSMWWPKLVWWLAVESEDGELSCCQSNKMGVSVNPVP